MVPRPVRMSQAGRIELHGFFYVRKWLRLRFLLSLCTSGWIAVTVRQIMSKTRVAPLKRVSLPRLEQYMRFSSPNTI